MMTPFGLLALVWLYLVGLIAVGFLCGHIAATRPETPYDRFRLWCAVNLHQLAQWMEADYRGPPPSPPAVGPGYWY